MIEGKSYPVYFSADTSVFNDPAFPEQYISYHDLYNLGGNYVSVVELNKDKRAMAIIDRPTPFLIGIDNFIVYPGEHILVKKGTFNDYTFLKTKRKSRRNRELAALTNFSKVRVYFMSDRPKDLHLSEILALEEKIRQEMPLVASVNAKKFDSLCKADRLSNRFKKTASDYLRDGHYTRLYPFYKSYRDTLTAYGLYQSKCRALVTRINQLPDMKGVNSNTVPLNEIADIILPYNIDKISNSNEYATCFDSIVQIFRGPTRDYFLSRLTYVSIIKRINTDSAHILKYEELTLDKTLKRAVYAVKKQQEAFDNAVPKDSEMTLVGVNGKTTTAIERVLNSNKGKIVILDFWATWCGPCREAAPKLDQLVKQYPEDKIVVIKISLDNQTQKWQKFVLANDKENKTTHFLLSNSKTSSFREKYNISGIPRYMVYNTEGTLITDKAPIPPATGLKEIIDNNLK